MQARTFLYAIATSFLVASSTAGCGSSQGGSLAGMGVAEATRSVDQRLQGDWRLVHWVPDAKLGSALSGLLTYDYANLSIHVDKGRLTGTAPTHSYQRNYRIENPQSPQFTVHLADETGVEYAMSCEFDTDNRLLFRSLTPPWTGKGLLERVTAPQAP